MRELLLEFGERCSWNVKRICRSIHGVFLIGFWEKHISLNFEKNPLKIWSKLVLKFGKKNIFRNSERIFRGIQRESSLEFGESYSWNSKSVTCEIWREYLADFGESSIWNSERGKNSWSVTCMVYEKFLVEFGENFHGIRKKYRKFLVDFGKIPSGTRRKLLLDIYEHP